MASSVPGTQIIQQNPPLYDFSKLLGEYLMELLNGQGLGAFSAPGNPYRLDVPLSPTTQMWGRMAQNYSQMGAPQVMGQAAGTLGQFMNPDYSSLKNILSSGFKGGKAQGGPVHGGVGPQGSTYMVGENGPETLQLDAGASGFVIPGAPGGITESGAPVGGAPGDPWIAPGGHPYPRPGLHFDTPATIGPIPTLPSYDSTTWGGGSGRSTSDYGGSPLGSFYRNMMGGF